MTSSSGNNVRWRSATIVALSTGVSTGLLGSRDPAIKERLRVRVAEHGHSMEAELRAIVTEAVKASSGTPLNLAEAIRRRFAPFGGVELDIPPRTPVRPPPTFK